MLLSRVPFGLLGELERLLLLGLLFLVLFVEGLSLNGLGVILH